MARSRNLKRRHIFVLLTIFALVGAGAVAASPLVNYFKSDVTVVRVSDGDTIVVARDNEEVAVRLLNIDTPELAQSGTEADCLAHDAKAFLSDLLPEGTEVRLEHDKEKTDRYSRELAGVFLGDTFINEKIAAAGLAVPMLIEPNDRFYPHITTAVAQAQAAGLGLFDPSNECTFEAQVNQAIADSAQTTQPPTEASLESLQAYESALAETLAILAALQALTTEGNHRIIPHLPSLYLTGLRGKLDAEHTRVAEAHVVATADIEEEETRLRQVEEDRKAKEEADRKAKEEADRKAKEEADRKAQQEAERQAAAEAERVRAQQPAQKPQAPAKPQPPAQKPATPAQKPAAPSNSNSGNSNRAPCRAYNPGGKTYKYIDCVTKAPLDGIDRS